jgi:UV DNA damage endonuclease
LQKVYNMLRLGLCCVFSTQPIKFRTATAAQTATYAANGRTPEEHLSAIIIANIASLKAAILWCYNAGIGSFRITSNFLPLYTHPVFGYSLETLAQSDTIQQGLEECKKLAKQLDIRLVLHPDQFVVLNSLSPSVVNNSRRELIYHGMLAEALGVDVINIHGGGVFGDKASALQRLHHQIEQLPEAVRSRLTLENDDKSYTPSDLLPICRALDVPLVYDVHHHRCNLDEMDIAAATSEALTTWTREPLFHISSPINGWTGKHPMRHHDYIDWNDFPIVWRDIPSLTVEIEAKAKEAAIQQLQERLRQEHIPFWYGSQINK